MPSDPEPEFRRATDPDRYELWLADERVGVAEFERHDGTIVATRTVIEPDRRGHGLGALLAERLLQGTRELGERVQPQCWFIAAYIDEHPEHHDLLAH